jgi:hypothetical protein
MVHNSVYTALIALFYKLKVTQPSKWCLFVANVNTTNKGEQKILYCGTGRPQVENFPKQVREKGASVQRWVQLAFYFGAV